VIGHDAVLEKRESELAKINERGEMVGEVAYSLRLSVQPIAEVEVRVKKDTKDSVDCMRFDDGLFLLQDTLFRFQPSNWNEPQTVNITIRRNGTTFQGTSVTRFLHEVKSEDPDWRSPFLRPMSVTIADDDECTPGAQKYDDYETGIRKCGCSEGFFVEATATSFCGSATKCGTCPAGMLCDKLQQDIEYALLESGKYRMFNTSLDVADCPIETACIGKANAGDALCRDGHTGPFCMVCVLNGTSRYEWNGDKCTVCDGGNEWEVYGVMTALGVGLLAVVASIVRYKAPTLSDGLSQWEEFVGQATTKYKILTKFLQARSEGCVHACNQMLTLMPSPALHSDSVQGHEFVSF
jgi:hypothetical protein